MINRPRNLRKPAVAVAVSFALLFGIFLKTMLHHNQAIDYPYLWYALPRIGLIALATGVLSLSINKKGWTLHVVIGVFVGFALAVTFVKVGMITMT